MNIIWLIIMVCGLSLLTINNPTNVFSILIESVKSSSSLLFSLFCIYAVWLGFLEIFEKTRLSSYLAKLFSPLITKLFGKVNDETKKLISINLTSNILGASNASTPAGLKAMDNLKKQNNTFAIKMLFLLNCVSLQLLPTTLIGLLSNGGSKNPYFVIFPIIAVSAICLTLLLLLTHLFYSKEKVK